MSHADAIIVATTRERPVPAAVVEWLGSLCGERSFPVHTVSVLYDADNDPNYFGSLCELLVRHEAGSAGARFVSQRQLAGACLR